MNLKTYHAYTMAEALAAVKRDLGADAVIVHTRTFRRGGVLGLGRKTIVEVTAGVGEGSPPSIPGTPKQSAGRSPRHVNAGRAYHKATATTEPIVSDAERTRRLAQALAERDARMQQTPVPASATPSAVPIQPQPTEKSTPPQAAVARRFVLMPPKSQDPDPSVSVSASQEPTLQPQVSANVSVRVTDGLMKEELSAIRDAVSRVLEGGSETPDLPESGRLFDLYLELVGQDLAEELAQQVVGEVRQSLRKDQLCDESCVRREVSAQLCRIIPQCDGELKVESTDGRPVTIAFVGPTGVGKTTTLAKLAAAYRLRMNATVGLITADTYRIAAVDQLRTYADILAVPLQVASTPEEMKAACRSFRDRQVILIDTAGRSQRDRDRIGDLRRILAAARPHEVHLVLSSTAAERTLMREAEAFATVGVDKVVLTKLDEAVGFGTLISVIRRVGKKISFVTTGQEVPDHIEPAVPQRLAELLLGGEVRG